MGKIESTIKSEIERLAKHEVRTVFRPLRREVWGIRLKLSNLLKAFAPMNRLAKEICRKQGQGTQIGGLTGGGEGFPVYPGKDPASQRETGDLAEGTGGSHWGKHGGRTLVGKGEIQAPGREESSLGCPAEGEESGM